MLTDNQTNDANDGVVDVELGMMNQIVEQAVVSVPTVQTPETITTGQILASWSGLVFAKENRLGILTSIALSVVGTGANFVGPMALAAMLQIYPTQQKTASLAGMELTLEQLLGVLISAYLLSQIATTLSAQILVPVTENNARKLLRSCMEHQLNKSLNYHVSQPFTAHTNFIQKGFLLGTTGTASLTQTVMPTVIQLLMADAYLFSRYGGEMGASALVLLAAYIVYGKLTTQYITQTNEDFLKSSNDLWTNLSGAIQRYQLMRTLGKYEDTINEFDQALLCWVKTFAGTLHKPLQIGMGYTAISYSHMFWVLWHVNSGVESGKYTSADFVVIVGYLLSLSSILPAFGTAINQLVASYPNAEFVFSELDQPDEVVDSHRDTQFPKNADDSAPSIEFEKVTFSYPPKPGELSKSPEISELSFSVAPNQRVALVGKNGQGKTTLFSLLFGYYQPNAGVIKINGTDIKVFSSKELQHNIGYFGQKPNLFKGSIRENIYYGAENPNNVKDSETWDPKIRDVASAAQLNDFLNGFSNGLNTDVGENGGTLSGGQQQKVAILRGLMRKRSILLFDEVTASMDNEAAAEVLQTIKAATEGVPSVMITHNLNQAREFASRDTDKIVVIHKGNVIAQGKHDELLKTCEIYGDLWRDGKYDQTIQATVSSTGLFASSVSRTVIQNADSKSNVTISSVQLTQGSNEDE